MDRPILKAVQAQVVKQMAARLAEFKMVEKPGIVHKPGGVFEFRVTDQLCFYIILQTNEYYNYFSYQIAWSEHSGFPYGPAGHIPIGCPEKKVEPSGPIEGKMVFSLNRLINPCDTTPQRPKQYPLKHLPSSWYFDEVKAGNVPLPDDVVAAVQNAVELSIDELVTHAIPYFQKIAADHGCQY